METNMRVNGWKIRNMDLECTFICWLEKNMKENGEMVWNKVKVDLISLTVIIMKEISIKVTKVDRELYISNLELDLEEIGKTIKLLDKEKWFMLMGMHLMVNIDLVRRMVLELTDFNQVLFMKENLKTKNFMERDF